MVKESRLKTISKLTDLAINVASCLTLTDQAHTLYPPPPHSTPALLVSSWFWAELTETILVVSFGNDWEQSHFFSDIRETRSDKSHFHYLCPEVDW